MPSDKYICGFGTDNHMPVKPVRTEPHWDQCLYSEYNKQVFIHVMLTTKGKSTNGKTMIYKTYI
jgi:hypothetical protein